MEKKDPPRYNPSVIKSPMTETALRHQKLRRNFYLMFWINAFLNVKLIAMLSTVFFLSRGLSASEIFATAIGFAVVNILLEIPSSYLADRLGRKKLIFLGLVLCLIPLFIYFVSWGFWPMFIAACVQSASVAFMSGTDDALIYDSNQELGGKDQSLKSLSNYYSGQRIFKFFTPILAALIVKDLTAFQFNIVILIDIVAIAVAVILSLLLVEPNHTVDLEKKKEGYLKDSLKLLWHDPEARKAMLNRTLIFTATFIVWRIQQDFFLDIGLSLLIMGVFSSFMQITIFITNRLSDRLEKRFSTPAIINFLNLINLFFLALFTLGAFQNFWPLLLLFLNTVYHFTEFVRTPIYSHYFNQKASSYNRATTLSVSNMLSNLMDLPLFFIAAALVSYDIRYSFILALVLTAIVYITTLLKPLPQKS